jgi:hypothetical protein
MIYLGILGSLAAVVGRTFHLDALRTFVGFWLGTAVMGVAGAMLIARRQALKDAEPFWSPPTRRVGQAVLPPLGAGLLLSVFLLVWGSGNMHPLFVFPNILFYGCAVHAAGFFMPRGMKLFGWLILASAGVTLLIVPRLQTDPSPALDHALMGFFFGVLHLAYGVYLYFTEKRKNAT